MQFTVTAVSPFTVTGHGAEGEYVIAKEGYHPQLHWAFSYGDGKYAFYFYVETKEDQPRYTLSVWYISAQRFAGLPPAIDTADADYIEQNIRQYLENVSIMSFEKVVPPHPVPSTTFDWRIRQ
ncbi:MAG TPA: hypothetical protein VFB68_00680 [Xanthobacteraceae bacterium]|nr:hypothetical protein [Xanthobacteraceae bacterium]